MTLTADTVAAMPRAQVRARVEHVDVDSFGVVHFSRYVSLFETAVLELMAVGGLTLESLLAEELELRVVELQVKYRSPAYFGDVLIFEAQVRQFSAATVTFEVTAERAGAGAQEVVVKGTLRMAFVRPDGAPVQVPASVVRRLAGERNNGEK
jgi:acyl-CoA thioester hydrolase